MVIIQPFEYEKTTAFKERVQIANKVNEIINLFNDLDIESKINIFNEEIEIINGKIAEINSKIIEVNNAVDIVNGYNTRLTSVENESVSLDARLDNLEPRVTITENKNTEQDTQITNLVTRVTATETKNTEQDTEINNIKNGNITFNGIKTFNNGFSGFFNDWKNTMVSNIEVGDIELIAKLIWGNGRYFYFETVESSNTAMFKCEFGVHIFANTGILGIFLNKGYGANNPSQNDTYVLAKTVDNEFYLGLRRKVIYGNVNIRSTLITNYAAVDTLDSNIVEWLDTPIVLSGGTSPDYEIIEALT